MTNELRIPLFALHTVLYPGGPLPLRIFEPRYLDMVSACLRQGSGFGVCLIRSGKEVGMAAQTYEVGTLSMIVDWHMRATTGCSASRCAASSAFALSRNRCSPTSSPSPISS